jgi:mitochondrial import inner membrane translocase subunit TIM22
MQTAMESCAGRSVMAGVGGFALGGMFGMFMASVRPSFPLLSLPSILLLSPN